METLWVTITVNVRDQEYVYMGPEGAVDMVLKVPRSMLEQATLAGPLATLTGSALAAYDMEAAKVREAALREETNDTTEG